MHLADGVLSLPVVAATMAGAGLMVAKAVKETKAQDIPKISLVSAGFFVLSFVHIPLGPTTVHMIMAGLLGILLGGLAPIAIFLGLVLQALLFQHGGVTTLGANLLLVAIPALVAAQMFYSLKQLPPFWRGAVVAASSVVLCVILLVTILLFTDERYGGGYFSLVNILVFSYLPLVLIEGVVTGFAVKLLDKARPDILQKRGLFHEG